MPEKTDNVFGIRRELPLNYQERDSADRVLKSSLDRQRHLVIYGSSKQGKTSLRKRNLKPDEYIVVHCSNKWDLDSLHSAILKQCGFKLDVSSSKTSSGKYKMNASIKTNMGAFDANIGGGAERTRGQTNITQSLELELEDVNDVIDALKSINLNKYIILEDFHYLPVETQIDFSVALKAFHENSEICFIVIGVWLEENRLPVYNGDLTGRVLSIDADKWEVDELKRVVYRGADLLNVEFDDEFLNDLLDACFNSVYVVQEVCYKCCIDSGVTSTQEKLMRIGNGMDASLIVRDIVNQQSGRFRSFITQFADGFQVTELAMYRWILLPVLTGNTAELRAGLRQKDIRDILKKYHPTESLNPGNVTQALQSVAALQIKKDIKPIVLDYDQTNLRLNIVDRSFLIWLENQARNDLLAVAGLDTVTFEEVSDWKPYRLF